jgi:3-methyladenine DNA glycosylase Tag
MGRKCWGVGCNFRWGDKEASLGQGNFSKDMSEVKIIQNRRKIKSKGLKARLWLHIQEKAKRPTC